MTLSASYDPTTALTLYNTSRSTTAPARLWAGEKLLHDLANIGFWSFFEGPGPDPSGLSGYSTSKIWMKTSAGITTEQATFWVYISGAWVALTPTNFDLWYTNSAAAHAANAASDAAIASNSATICSALAGITNVYATKAAMTAAAAGISADAFALVLVDEDKGNRATVYQKQTGVMTFIRILFPTGGAIDVRDFGINGGADETTEFFALNAYLQANDGCRVFFPPAAYEYTNPKWLVGVRNVEIFAHGATFENIGAGSWAEGSMDAAIYIGSGLYTHTMTEESPIDGSGNPETGITATSGDLIDSVAVGSATVTCKTAANAANYGVGDNVMVCWFYHQTASFPQNPKYFEYAKVLSSNAGTGIVTLTRPLRYAYKDTAPDTTTYTIACGKARILNLNRADYDISENIIWRGGTTVKNGLATTIEYDGTVSVSGALNVHIHDVNAAGIYPTMSKAVHCEDCGFDTFSEFDKLIEDLTFTNCRLQNAVEGTSVERLRITGGEITGTLSRYRARDIVIDGVFITSNPASDSSAQISNDQYACSRFEVRNCRFVPSATRDLSIQPGNVTTFEPDSVSATTIVVNTTNTAYADILQNCYIGQRVTIGEEDTGAANVFVITDHSFDGSGHLTLTGYHNVASPRAASDTRVLWQCQNAVLKDNIFAAVPSSYQTASLYRRAYNLTENDNTFRARLHRQLTVDPSLNGFPVEVVINVVKVYTGSDGTAELTCTKAGPGTAWGGAYVNLKVAGRRVISVGSTSGAQSGDTLNSFTAGTWVETFQIYQDGAGSNAYVDGSDDDLPVVEIEIKVARI